MGQTATASYIDPIAVGRRLGELRDRAKLTQGAFADALGVPRRSYVNYEHGDREAPLGVIKAAHQIFGADVLWLLTGIPAPEATPAHDAVDFELVLQVVGEVQSQLAARGRALRPTDQARLVRLVYAWCQDTGGFQPDRVSYALDLAVGQ